MATYTVTYETEDGTVDSFTTETTKTAALKMARNCAKGSALNGALNVTRWFVEADNQTLATFPVAA